MRRARNRPVVCARSRSGSVSPAIQARSSARPLVPSRSEIDAGDLDVGVLERLLDAQRRLRHLSHQLLAGSRQVAQLLDGSGRHKAPPGQPMRQEVGQPCRIGDVALAAGDLAHGRRVSQLQVDAVFQQVPDRLPLHAGRFQNRVRAPLRFQPVAQFSRSAIVVPNVRVSRSTRRPRTCRTHATTVSLWTSRPAQRACTTSIVRPLCRPHPPGAEPVPTNSTNRAQPATAGRHIPGCSPAPGLKLPGQRGVDGDAVGLRLHAHVIEQFLGFPAESVVRPPTEQQHCQSAPCAEHDSLVGRRMLP